jgi:hypothetical protein
MKRTLETFCFPAWTKAVLTALDSGSADKSLIRDLSLAGMTISRASAVIPVKPKRIQAFGRRTGIQSHLNAQHSRIVTTARDQRLPLTAPTFVI